METYPRPAALTNLAIFTGAGGPTLVVGPLWITGTSSTGHLSIVDR